MNGIDCPACSQVCCWVCVLTQFNSFADSLCLYCWCLGLADFAESTGEVSIHHAVNVPLEVSQDDTLSVLLHLHSHWTVCSVRHGSAVTENTEKTEQLENCISNCITPQDPFNNRYLRCIYSHTKDNWIHNVVVHIFSWSFFACNDEKVFIHCFSKNLKPISLGCSW